MSVEIESNIGSMRSRILRDKRRAAGLCAKCGRESSSQGNCETCKEKARRRNARRRTVGLCTQCAAPAAPTLVLCPSCAEKQRKSCRKRYDKRHGVANIECKRCGQFGRREFCGDCIRQLLRNARSICLMCKRQRDRCWCHDGELDLRELEGLMAPDPFVVDTDVPWSDWRDISLLTGASSVT